MLRRVTPLDGEAILPLTDAKEHLRVLHSDEDSLIAAARDAACAYIERQYGVALAPATFAWSMKRLEDTRLPVRPVTSITEVRYVDSAGAEQTYADARLISGAVVPAFDGSWPGSYGSAEIEFVAGFEDVANEAADLMAAVKLMTGHLYANREAVVQGSQSSPLAMAVDALCSPYRLVLV